MQHGCLPRFLGNSPDTNNRMACTFLPPTAHIDFLPCVCQCGVSGQLPYKLHDTLCPSLLTSRAHLLRGATCFIHSCLFLLYLKAGSPAGGDKGILICYRSFSQLRRAADRIFLRSVYGAEKREQFLCWSGQGRSTSRIVDCMSCEKPVRCTSKTFCCLNHVICQGLTAGPCLSLSCSNCLV